MVHDRKKQERKKSAIAFCCILFIVLFALLSLVACGKKTNVKGVIISKYINPPHTIYQPLYTGKVMMMMPYTHPEEHIIVVEVDLLNEQFERNVGHDLYNEVSVGDSVMIEVRIQ
jgi:hypothetical protein